MEEFVPYDQAIQLREIGFDDRTIGIYTENGLVIFTSFLNTTRVVQTSNQDREFTVKAPLWQQAFNWFREQHNLEQDIYWNTSGYYVLFCYDKLRERMVINHISLERNIDYYNAQLDLLNRLIEIVNNKLKQN